MGAQDLQVVLATAEHSNRQAQFRHGALKFIGPQLTGVVIPSCNNDIRYGNVAPTLQLRILF